jgi:exodeoxyribonuclease-3
VKAFQDQVPPEVIQYAGYEVFWHAAKKPGYSGTACITRVNPNQVVQGFGLGKETEAYDQEGRVLQLHFDDFILLNCYFPNAQPDHARLPYKLGFNQEVLKFCDRARAEGKEVIVCGDFNVAHEEIDLARPKENENSSGFLPEERAWMTQFLGTGMVDAYRSQYPQSKKGSEYTWWTYRANARANNVGWRIDYFTLSPKISKKLKNV